MDRYQAAHMLGPGVVATVLSEIVRLHGHDAVDDPLDLLLQALLLSPADVETALDEIIYWCSVDEAAQG